MKVNVEFDLKDKKDKEAWDEFINIDDTIEDYEFSVKRRDEFTKAALKMSGLIQNCSTSGQGIKEIISRVEDYVTLVFECYQDADKSYNKALERPYKEDE